jgi:type 1 glutamine amidotransferase
MGRENNFAADTTKDSSAFTNANLEQYAAVIFLCTTGDVLNDEQQKVFEQYIKKGGGFVGIHSATDTEYDWPWYNQLVGAYFKSHPKQQEAVLHLTDPNFIATSHLPQTWKRWDEWYNFKQTNWDKVHVLLTIDESSYSGGENGDYHPMSWYHEFEGGRAFYTELGHTKESYSEPLYLQHLLGGIKYAMGKM